jgi:RNA polymerase sigma-70 factor (ECF subfamily)
MHRGLQDADAADLAQEVLRCVIGAVPGFQYDPSIGSFRGWLFTITRHELLKMAKRRTRQPGGTGDSAIGQLLEQHPEPESDQDYWDREYRLRLFHWAAKKVQPEFRPATWEAFWLTAVQARDVNAVAEQLGISAGAVYIARSRITARIRQEIAAVEGE